MSRWRIVGLVVLALLAASLLAWWLRPEPQPVPPPQPAAREVFHSSKPLRTAVESTQPAAETAWLDYELRQLLNRGRMRVAAVDDTTRTFTLRVALDAEAKKATLALVAPDGVVERQEPVQLPTENRLATLSALAQHLPRFLGAQPAGSPDWVAAIGTADANAYDAYLADAMDLLGPGGHGLTRPGVPQSARTVERLEALARHQPRFARARAALAIAYLSLGGQDQASLSQLAKTSAERALAADDEIAEAHAALGLVHMRSGDWTAAREQFDRALTLDPNSAAALEGSGCLLVDAGGYAAARPFVEHAVQLQPNNVGARECLAYLDVAAGKAVASDEKQPSAVARVHALAAILAGDVDTARRALRASTSDDDFREWADPLLQAATDRARIPDALQSITRAASDGRIDAATEILCGAALRRAEFVFNRMARLQREREPVPLRMLWMPQTPFLRRHARFEQIVSAAGLPAFWQEYGVPDVCGADPKAYGCKARTLPQKKASREP
ncbi:MAG TPA: tetratricopeptide repeat protein [Steroidobacteraceae bacterium]|nr:tetratricopeptide repeat protein [Steroidobacteraceae bacterium]